MYYTKMIHAKKFYKYEEKKIYNLVIKIYEIRVI